MVELKQACAKCAGRVADCPHCGGWVDTEREARVMADAKLMDAAHRSMPMAVVSAPPSRAIGRELLGLAMLLLLVGLSGLLAKVAVRLFLWGWHLVP